MDSNSREVYLAIIERLRGEQFDGVIPGCSESGMLVGPEHTDLKRYDTTALHAE